MKVLVTGGTGFLGRHVVKQLHEKGYETFVPDSKKYDLTNNYSAFRLINDSNPDYIIHLAAKVGGIGFNQANPSICFASNLAINLNLIDKAVHYCHHLKKFVAIGSVCAYPADTPVPFKETSLWDGYPEPTNAPYGLAKRMLLTHCQVQRQQTGFPAIYLLPANMYGPGDHFETDRSHVVPALIRKCVEARDKGLRAIEVWGDGTATRDFLYVEDAAEGIIKAMEMYDSPQPVNLGTGRETTIGEVVGLIAARCGLDPFIEYQHDKPNGQQRRVLDIIRARQFEWQAKTTLEEGLRKTIEWYTEPRVLRPVYQVA